MADNDKYSTMFKIVKEAIDELNPYDLLPEAPDDEFDSESSEIARKINVNNSIEEIAKIISVTISRTFDNSRFNSDYCMKAAEKINEELNNLR
jgi:hypothetical protein